ncbi:DUF4136 domain-containing protein [Pararhodonellum marinum]|uniref:DUF4136 domain-containing protein n=1 Tax=Pararhodonellum marinum TaxID=2755358 RepID=UPI00188EF52C|nr:DUF4136 domain-containing protein [Pararhodonellum marinum]
MNPFVEAKSTLKRIFSPILFLVGGSLFFCCVPDGPDAIEQIDVVYTNHNPSFNFSSRLTYSLPESVILIEQEVLQNPDTPPAFADFLISQGILSSIRTNMNARGYSLVDVSANPDLILLPSITITENLRFSYSWWYWGWFYPNFQPDWGWVYPGYTPIATRTMETGTLLIQLSDPKGITSDNRVPIHWIVALNGRISQSTGNNLNRIQSNIDLAFNLSPYLSR